MVPYHTLPYTNTKINNNWTKDTIEGLHRIRPKMTFNVMSNSPFVSQENIRQFGRRI